MKNVFAIFIAALLGVGVLKAHAQGDWAVIDPNDPSSELSDTNFVELPNWGRSTQYKMRDCSP